MLRIVYTIETQFGGSSDMQTAAHPVDQRLKESRETRDTLEFFFRDAPKVLNIVEPLGRAR